MTRIATLACLLLLLAPRRRRRGRRQGGDGAGARTPRWRPRAPSSGALAVDLDTGETIYRLRADTPRMPASVEKLYTSATALERFGAAGRLATTVYAETPPDAEGVVDGDLFLRGGGDPNLDVIDLGKLAEQVDDAGITGHHRARDRRRVRLGHPARRPLQRLRAHLGRRRALRADRQPRAHGQARPLLAAAAGEVQRERLRQAAAPPRRGRPRVTRRGRTPEDAEPIAAWRSASMRSLVRQMNPPSDNFMAEMLIKAIAVADGELGTTLGGRRGDRGDAGQGVRASSRRSSTAPASRAATARRRARW